MMTVLLTAGMLSAGMTAVSATPARAGTVPITSGAAVAATAAGSFQALAPSRLLDTRAGIGAPAGRLAASGDLTLQITGRGGVPAWNVSAVLLNVTVVTPAGAGYLTVYPAGTSRPKVSSLNFTAGMTVANSVLVPVSGDGRIQLFNSATSGVHVVADVAGYHVAGTPSAAGSFQPVTPARLLDTRFSIGTTTSPIPANSSASFQVAGRGSVPSSGVSAVLLNITATSPGAAGFVTAYPDGGFRPTTSIVNFTAHTTVANLVVVPVGSNGRVRLFNRSDSSVQFLADIAGYYLSGSPTVAGALRSFTPTRLIDTRSGFNTPVARLAPVGSLSVQVTGPGAGGVRAFGVTAVAVNVTVTGPTAGGFLTVAPDGRPRPQTSSTNFVGGQTVANLVVVPVGADGRIRIWNSSGGSINLVVDVVGVFYDGSLAAGGLTPGQTLGSGASLRTADGQTVLTMQNGGDLVLTRAGSQLWHSDTGGSAGARLVLLSDGNLVIYDAANAVRWSSRTAAHPGAALSLTDGLMSIALGNATLWASTPSAPKSCDAVSSDPAGTAITRWNPITLCVLAALGEPSSAESDVNIIIDYESGGDSTAINLWDRNFLAGHPSKGLIQVIQSTFDYYRTSTLANDLYDPAANLYAGLNYAVRTYGSIHNVPGLISLRNGGPYKGYVATN